MAMIKLSSIKPNPNNPRIIKNEKFEKLKRSIEEFPEMMELRPIVIDENNVIIGGNMRFKALQDLGKKEVPSSWIKKASELTEDQKNRFVITDNASFGEWEWEAIKSDWDLGFVADWGVDIPEFEPEKVEAKEDDYEMPDEIKTDIVLGDLFEIGEHRLLCGSSIKDEEINKLMDGIKPDLVFTDPPYGIKVVNNTSVGGGGAIKFGGKKGKVVASTKGFSEIIGDDTTGTASGFYAACKRLGFKNFIIFGGNYFTDFLPPSMGWIVWYKKNTGNFADFEMAWTSFDRAARLYEYLWNGLSREGSREIELKKRVHPTQKPVGLNMNILNEYQCDLIFDGFLGSGSTMVAAHQLNRKCYGMEIDPKYCQVIIDRMLKLDPSLKVLKNGKPYAHPGR
jgi:hypothetical protein